MFQVFFSLIIVLATPIEDHHLEYIVRTMTGKPLIMEVIRCIKKDGYVEVRKTPINFPPSPELEGDQFVFVSCYLPNPVVEETPVEEPVEKASR